MNTKAFAGGHLHDDVCLVFDKRRRRHFRRMGYHSGA